MVRGARPLWRPRTAGGRRSRLGFRPQLDPLEIRLVLTTIAEVEPNNTLAVAQAVAINAGNVTTTSPDNWLNITGLIDSATDVDFFQFTVGQRSGVFLDIDSRETGTSTTLNSILTLFDSAGTQLDTNDNGYDFTTGFPAPASLAGAGTADSALYRDLSPGTYLARVSTVLGSTGSYVLGLLADSLYSATVPAFNSLPGAADTLFLDFDGHASTGDAWNGGSPYTIPAFDHNGNAGEFSPGERLAIRNAWRVVAEDYSPFRINVSTNFSGAFADGVAFRQVIGNSNGSQVGFPGVLGVAKVGSYAAGGANNQLAFTFANNFSTFGGGESGRIMAQPVELGNTSAHEFGHALGLDHYTAAGQEVGIMFTPDQGLSRETWFRGTNTNGTFQDDMAIIGNATNTFGFRADDHGNTFATATSLGGFGVLKATGIIGNLNVLDVDMFRFTQSFTGSTTIKADVQEFANDLDAEVRIFNSSGGLIATADLTSFDVSLQVFLAAGTYFVEVRSDGGPGEAGQYELRVTRPPAIGITDVTVNEVDSGSVNVVFQVGLDGPSAVPVTVDFAAANGSAVAPGDYAAFAGTLTFNPGETVKFVTIPVRGDTLLEPTETFFINLSNTSGAPLVDAQGVGTIVDNDTPTITIGSAAVVEGDSGTRQATFTVQLSRAVAQTVTVRYATANATATAPSDYTAVALTTLTFNPGETSKTISVAVRGDNLIEDDETFRVLLSSPVNARIANGVGFGEIITDDFPPKGPVPETASGGGTATLDASETVDSDLDSGRTLGAEAPEVGSYRKTAVAASIRPDRAPPPSPLVVDALVGSAQFEEWLTSIRPGRLWTRRRRTAPV